LYREASVAADQEEGREGDGQRKLRNIVNWTGLDINTAARFTEDRYRWHHVLLTANPPGRRHLTTTIGIAKARR